MQSRFVASGDPGVQAGLKYQAYIGSVLAALTTTIKLEIFKHCSGTNIEIGSEFLLMEFSGTILNEGQS